MRGLIPHLLMTLRLNQRNPQALIFGYIVPVLFLVAFGSVFGTTASGMQQVLGKVLTIAAMGGACFGLPITLVAERERGVWRRYRLSPIGAPVLILSTVLARLLILLLSGMLVVGAAMLFYGMPWPTNIFAVLIAYLATCLAFIGLGLLIAMLANSVGAVQAMGQCLFLPMLIIGGVAVPLPMLPGWAQTASLFMPGRSGVMAIDHATLPALSLAGAWFPLLALLVSFAAGIVAAGMVFRWDVAAPPRRHIVGALALIGVTWAILGLIQRVLLQA